MFIILLFHMSRSKLES